MLPSRIYHPIFSNENLFDHTEPLRTLVGISHQMHVEIFDLEDSYFGNHKMINFPKNRKLSANIFGQMFLSHFRQVLAHAFVIELLKK